VNFELLEQRISEARTVDPGPYGGRYVVRSMSETENPDDEYQVFQSDDPNELPDNLSAIAHCTKDKVAGIGHSRYYVNEDGTIDREYFNN